MRNREWKNRQHSGQQRHVYRQHSGQQRHAYKKTTQWPTETCLQKDYNHPQNTTQKNKA